MRKFLAAFLMAFGILFGAIAGEFTVTTVPLTDETGHEFRFAMYAYGTFTIDWGDGNIDTISRAAPDDFQIYSHEYQSDGTYNIVFSGVATGHYGSVYIPSIEFGRNERVFIGDGAPSNSSTSIAGSLTPLLVASVSGSLGSVFQ